MIREKKGKIKDIIIILTGLFITAVSFNLFFLPNNLVVYDSSGLAIIIEHFFKVDPSLFIFLFLAGCLVVGFIFLGFKDTKNAILTSIFYPIFVKLTENIGNYITFDDPDMLVISIFAGITTGFGTGLVFRSGYNTGGTDIIELIVCKYLKIPMFRSMIIVDGAIVLAGSFVFGYELLFYALIVLVLIAFVSDKILLGVNDKKTLYIISKRKTLIERFLIEGLKRKITILEATGARTLFDKDVIYCVVYNRDYYKVKEGILAIDPNAFVVVTDTYEAIKREKL